MYATDKYILYSLLDRRVLRRATLDSLSRIGVGRTLRRRRHIRKMVMLRMITIPPSTPPAMPPLETFFGEEDTAVEA